MLDCDLVPGPGGVGVGGRADGLPAFSLYPLSRVLGDLGVGDDLPRFYGKGSFHYDNYR